MSSLYGMLVKLIEQRIGPLAGKLGQQRYVLAIRDGFIAALPFMIVGSFMLVFIFPPISSETTWGFARAWLDFSNTYRAELMLPFNMSMGLMTAAALMPAKPVPRPAPMPAKKVTKIVNKMFMLLLPEWRPDSYL